MFSRYSCFKIEPGFSTKWSLGSNPDFYNVKTFKGDFVQQSEAFWDRFVGLISYYKRCLPLLASRETHHKVVPHLGLHPQNFGLYSQRYIVDMEKPEKFEEVGVLVDSILNNTVFLTISTPCPKLYK